MKSVLLLLVTLWFTHTHASTDLCQLFDEDSSTQLLYEKEVRIGVEFNNWEVEKIMTFVSHQELIHIANGTMLSFSDVRDVFDNSDYDELHMRLLKSTSTGHIYAYIWSYPGDNEYGVFLDVNSKIVAEVQDSDLVVDGQYCPYE